MEGRVSPPGDPLVWRQLARPLGLEEDDGFGEGVLVIESLGGRQSNEGHLKQDESNQDSRDQFRARGAAPQLRPLSLLPHCSWIDTSCLFCFLIRLCHCAAWTYTTSGIEETQIGR